MPPCLPLRCVPPSCRCSVAESPILQLTVVMSSDYLQALASSVPGAWCSAGVPGVQRPGALVLALCSAVPGVLAGCCAALCRCLVLCRCAQCLVCAQVCRCSLCFFCCFFCLTMLLLCLFLLPWCCFFCSTWCVPASPVSFAVLLVLPAWYLPAWCCLVHPLCVSVLPGTA